MTRTGSLVLLILVSMVSAVGAQTLDSVRRIVLNEKLRSLAPLLGTWTGKAGANTVYMKIESSDPAEVSYTVYMQAEHTVPSERYHGTFTNDPDGRIVVHQWNFDGTSGSGSLTMKNEHSFDMSLLTQQKERTTDFRTHMDVAESALRYRGEFKPSGASAWSPGVDVLFERITGFGWIQ